MKKHIIIIFSIFTVLFLTSCANNTTTDTTATNLEYGMIFSDPSKVSQSYLVGYESETNQFDINDVSFTLHIGIRELSFYSITEGTTIYLYSQVLNSQDFTILDEIIDYDVNTFAYEQIELEDNKYQINYNYSSEITLPADLFTESEGIIVVGVAFLYEDEFGELQIGASQGKAIYYELNDQIVTLLNN